MIMSVSKKVQRTGQVLCGPGVVTLVGNRPADFYFCFVWWIKNRNSFTLNTLQIHFIIVVSENCRFIDLLMF